MSFQTYILLELDTTNEFVAHLLYWINNSFQLLQHGYASEMYIKIGDTKALLDLHVETKHWDEV